MENNNFSEVVWYPIEHIPSQSCIYMDVFGSSVGCPLGNKGQIVKSKVDGKEKIILKTKIGYVSEITSLLSGKAIYSPLEIPVWIVVWKDVVLNSEIKD